MRRIAVLLAALSVLLSPAPAHAAQAAQSWALPEIRTVVAHGLMARDAASFRPDDVLVRAELEQLVSGLSRTHAAAGLGLPRTPAVAGRGPDETISMQVLNARLVHALGLRDSGHAFANGLRRAGITPTPRFGTEVVARMLGLRKNHPAAQDSLERLPTDPASRAEAAYSAARILQLRGSRLDAARTAAASFAVPDLDPWQRRILTTAFSLVGFPYVWGGESERPNGPFRTQLQGGFDCSGFVWRVYKLHRYPGADRLPGVLRGRTTFAMSGEVPASARIPFARLQPGDVVFFGLHGPRSTPAEVDHMGIYVGEGWFVHSSRDGVTLTPLAGWFRERFAWARRPLAEAGLVAPPSSS
jgi:cell wall-associated NlpC family hydrolase